MQHPVGARQKIPHTPSSGRASDGEKREREERRARAKALFSLLFYLAPRPHLGNASGSVGIAAALCSIASIAGLAGQNSALTGNVLGIAGVTYGLVAPSAFQRRSACSAMSGPWRTACVTATGGPAPPALVGDGADAASVARVVRRA